MREESYSIDHKIIQNWFDNDQRWLWYFTEVHRCTLKESINYFLMAVSDCFLKNKQEICPSKYRQYRQLIKKVSENSGAHFLKLHPLSFS